MLRVYVRAYTSGRASFIPDSKEQRIEITQFLTSVFWSQRLVSPYETASVTAKIPLEILGRVLKLGSPLKAGGFNLHCSGWLELIEEDLNERVFFGVISRIQTGVQVDHSGTVKSDTVSIEALSWLTLLDKGFKLSSKESLSALGSLWSLQGYSDIFDAVVQTAGGKGLGKALAEMWETLVLHAFPDKGGFYDAIDVYYDAESIKGKEDTVSMLEVEGRNLSQIQVPLRGSLLGLIRSTWQPIPQLIELFPRYVNGKESLIYRFKPLHPSANKTTAKNYFLENSYLEDHPAPKIASKGSYSTPQNLENITRFTFTLSSENRGNYIEVTTPYTGADVLAGISTDPIARRSDIELYGLHSLEFSYPFFRDTEGSMRDALADLTEYMGALYAEGNAYGVLNVEMQYNPRLVVGEWGHLISYLNKVEFESSILPLVGYIDRVQHSMQIDPRVGTQTRRTSVSLSRVSTGIRPSFHAVSTDK